MLNNNRAFQCSTVHIFVTISFNSLHFYEDIKVNVLEVNLIDNTVQLYTVTPTRRK